MGITNLLPILAPISHRNVSLYSYKGKRIAIDGFVWLHRASYRCAREIVLDPGTDAIIPIVMQKLERLQKSGVIPIIVFDGKSLPQKANTTLKRRSERAKAKEDAILLDNQGFSEQALRHFQRAIEITSVTVHNWIKHLKKVGVEYIVAPYEADAQLAYLCRTKYVDFVLTEDSDLLPYQTPHILYKYDEFSQTATYVNFQEVLNHFQLTADQFIAICCLSGCDYMEHINRLGFQTALKLIKIHKEPLELLNFLRSDPKFTVPEDYHIQLDNAMLTFKAQKVFDPKTKTLQNLIPIDSSPEFLGPEIPSDILPLLVKGLIDTKTNEKLVFVAPESPQPDRPHSTITPEVEVKETAPVSKYFNSYRLVNLNLCIH